MYVKMKDMTSLDVSCMYVSCVREFSQLPVSIV